MPARNDNLMPQTFPFRLGSFLRRLKNNGVWEVGMVAAGTYEPRTRKATVRIINVDKSLPDEILTANDLQKWVRATGDGKLSFWHQCPEEFLGENLNNFKTDGGNDTFSTSAEVTALLAEIKSLNGQVMELRRMVKTAAQPPAEPVPAPPPPTPASVEVAPVPRNGARFRTLGWKQADIDHLDEVEWAALQANPVKKPKV